MDDRLSFAQFRKRFADDEMCLEEIKRLRFPHGIFCNSCKLFIRHYKLKGRAAYACKLCRRQVYPLSGTLFDKSSTPLTKWLYGLFLMTQTRAEISGKQLQQELGVTYKTAWRMKHTISILMQKNKGDLLKDLSQRGYQEHKWVFFNKLEFTFVSKKSTEKVEEK